MSEKYEFPLTVPAIKVEQPLGEFYVVALTARLLLDTCYTINVDFLDDEDESKKIINYLGTFVNKIKGSQRERNPKRLNEIKRYSETVDACFPNAIILGANYDENGNLITNYNDRWKIVEDGGGRYSLIIPSKKKLASIIDGQHRVFGFENSKSKDMPLLCSVFIDLPLPYHASIFANINMNQKRVDKNLAYNLFQFDMEQGNPSTWTPETLAVYFARVLAEDDVSPIKGMIKLGLANTESDSTISMACIIDGILSLITTNPKSDRELMHSKPVNRGRSRSLVEKSSAPLRDLFVEVKDRVLFDLIIDFFTSLKKSLWRFPIFKKTLGVHACFDVLKVICVGEFSRREVDEKYFDSIFGKVEHVNFYDDYFSTQSKLRQRIRNVILVKSGLKEINEIKMSEDEYNKFVSFLHKES